jgi:HNH endonuclease
MLGIEELRRIPVLNQASFLKAGPATTVLPLKVDQADVLLRILCTRNPELRGIWPDVEIRAYAELLPDIDDTFSGREGGLKIVWHFPRERNRGIVEAKKQAVLKACGRLECEACGFNFESRYGVRGQGFCEVQHRLPLSEVDTEVETELDDLAVLCSNCHRMIPRSEPWVGIDELKRLIRGLA